MKGLSDATLRRLAWAGWWVMPALFALEIALRYAESGNDGPWSGDTVFNLVLVGLVMCFPLVGLLILRQQPRNAIGWLLLGVGLVWGAAGLLGAYAFYGLVVAPGALPGADVATALGQGTWAPCFGLMGTLVILTFPDGHLPSPRWRPVAWVAGLSLVMVWLIIAFLPGRMQEGPVPGLVNPLGWQAGEGLLKVLLVVFLPLVPLSILACVTGLVTRFRRSTGVERQQLKWLVAAGAVVATFYLLAVFFSLLTNTTSMTPTPALDVFQRGALLSFVLLPVAIGVAVLRHGLYEIDVLINRTLVYALLTAMLVLMYLVTVLLLQLVLAPLTNESDLAVAGSTLTVAAVFGPARRRIQRIVDRRFYRSKYDAERTLDEFATRLRHEVDLAAVGADLRGTVDIAVQPAHVSLWTRP